jgi:hypothetical protein
MRYKVKSTAALDIILDGLPDKMRVEVDRGIGVAAKSVGDLRKLTTWPGNLAIITPRERHPESVAFPRSHRAHFRPCRSHHGVTRADLIGEGLRVTPVGYCVKVFMV